jgi:glycosyltransferase involved in cell wall biosynthesis
MKKILLICNESKTVINFRKELILFLIDKKYEVELIVGDEEYLSEILELGVNVDVIPFDNRSTNPFSSLRLIKLFKKAINLINPDIIFTFQLKPNIFGTFAAKKCKNVRIYNMVEGLGDPFQPTNFKGKIIRTVVSNLYRRAFKYSDGVFFLNIHDREEFISRRIITKEKCILINGIGIDTSKYIPDYEPQKENRVVYLSRLIKNKGIIEFCKIAQMTRKLRKDIFFDLYGSESQLSVQDLGQYIDDQSITYHGYTDKPKEIIANSCFMVSTSYREGFPRIILEAMALGKPVIASNVIGNKDIVQDGITGCLVNLDNLQDFCNCIIKLIDDKEQIIKLGKQARQFCVENYDSKIINNIILKNITNKEIK